MVVTSLLLIGCTGDTEVVVEDDNIDEIPSENLEQDQGDSTPEAIIEIGGSDLCDNTNPDHCLLLSCHPHSLM